ncbi:TIR domain-containing protein [Sphingomonas mesophila]|uniref:TIR domain-containing protein n=1 Tax=Sphingomonas mesophila TaxID=2303576 RepID=UPI000E58F7A9|nr:TIR domain-containing protein [Sphingomonas mesophila]
MADVFISYARADQKVAAKVAAALQKASHSVWWDADLPAHRAYSDEIEQQLRSAKAAVVLWSRDAAASQWVRAEADLARGEGKLVQLSIDGTTPPLPFNQIQCADLSSWRGGTRHAGLAKALASVGALVAGGAKPYRPRSARAAAARPWARWAAAAALLLLLAGGAFLALRWWQGDSERRPVVAVLPFESLDPANRSFAAGMWEDTRQAIGRNPQLLVIGPNSAREIAGKDPKAVAKVADYLVEGSVRSAADRVRINASLVRTKDGSSLWSKSFERQLKDVFALQGEIAGEIEGHIRGRLAERGGVRPQNFATSGEVYALYNEARATIRRRDTMQYRQAREQLRQAVKLDPNFAPGWATLAVAELIYGPSTDQSDIGYDKDRSQKYARRAIALAPNLAAGHAALGLALRRGPRAEAALQRAIELDPNDFESISWLANFNKGAGKEERALELYSRAAEIEPLFWPAALNKLDLLLRKGDAAKVEAEMKRIEKLGDPTIRTLARIEVAQARGDLSEATRIALGMLKSDPRKSQGIVGFPLYGLLLQLGYEAEARRAFPPPPFGPLLWANDPRGLAMVDAMNLPPQRFFGLHPLPMNAGRVYVVTGRGAELAAKYRAVARSPEDFVEVVGTESDFATVAPFLALALRQDNDPAAANAVLALAERILTTQVVERRADQDAKLARVRAVQGKAELALKGLEAAVRGGWLPNPPSMMTDIAKDPALDSLKSDPRFEAARQRILGHLRKERAELGPISVD